jgi:DNA-binding NarL/FixJ family response regulator
MNRILVIEDERPLRETLASVLQREGFDVVAAEDGRRGIEIVRAQAPDLVLCDVNMPEMDGHDVLAELRADPKFSELPFVFLTAKTDRSDVRAGMNLGADDYLTKPVITADLLAAIQTRLARRKAQAERAREMLASAEITADFSSAEPLRALGITAREAEVLLWVAQGKSNPDIAVILGMSDKTVKKHLQNIFTKLGVENRNAATVRALDILNSAAPRQGP